MEVVEILPPKDGIVAKSIIANIVHEPSVNWRYIGSDLEEIIIVHNSASIKVLVDLRLYLVD